jgi:type 1 glutamine amidotransferase
MTTEAAGMQTTGSGAFRALRVFVSFVILCSAAMGAQAGSPGKKILLIYTPPDHPHGSHMYEHESRLLAKCLEQTAGVSTHISLNWPSDPAVLDGVSSIVFYTRPAGDIVLGEANRQQFMELMKRGVGYVAIHWATSHSKVEGAHEYLGLLGGAFNFAFANPPLAVTKELLIQADADHPICRGWAPFELRDEWYLAMKFDEKATPLLKVRVRPDESQRRPQPIDLIVAWTLEREGHSGGRSFGTTLGHFHDNFGIEGFRRMLVNGILWTARADVPVHGAPVAVDDADLILPPPPPRPQ